MNAKRQLAKFTTMSEKNISLLTSKCVCVYSKLGIKRTILTLKELSNENKQNNFILFILILIIAVVTIWLDINKYSVK